MPKQRVFADFHNADAQGRLRLNCIGTVQDLTHQQILLYENLSLTLYSEDIEAEGMVSFSSDENIWVAVIDWNAVKRMKPNPDASSNNEHVQRKLA